MMTDSQKLDLLLSEVAGLKQDMTTLNERTGRLEEGFLDVKLHLENFTDKNISVLAENHLTLIEKLNQSVKAAETNSIYEIKVGYLTEKVEKLEKEFHEFVNKSA